MSAKSPFSLRAWLALLVVGVAIPLIAFAGVTIWSILDANEQERDTDLSNRARAIASAVDAETRSWNAALYALAENKNLRAGQLEEFYHEAQAVAARYEGWVVINDATGQQRLNTLLPLGAPLPRTTAGEMVAAVLRDGKPLTDLVYGAAAQRYIISNTVPVFREGQVVLCLSMNFGPERLTRLLEEQKLPPTWVAAIVNRQNRVVSRSIKAEERIGKLAPQALQQAVAQSETGLVNYALIDGRKARVAFRHLREVPWALALAVPVAELPSPRHLIGFVVIGILLAGVAVGAAVAVARRIAHPISRLAHLAPSLVRGDAAGIDVAPRIAEVRQLQEALVEAAEQVQAHAGERERAAEILRLSSAYTRSLIEASLDPLVTIGPDGTITDVNAATEAATGQLRSALIGTDFSDYFTEPARARAGYEQVFRDGFVRDYPLELRHRDGRVMSVLYNASVYRDETGKVQGVFAAARDITERKRAEDIIRLQADQYRAMLATTSDGFWLYDTEGNLLDVNDVYCRMSGYSRDELLHMRISEIEAIESPEEVVRHIRQVVEGTGFDRFESQHRRKDGSLWDVEISATYWRTTGQMLVFCRDITQRKQAEEALRRLTEELEARVQRRTAALQEANIKLEAANTQTQEANKRLEEMNAELQQEVEERQRVEEELANANAALKNERNLAAQRADELEVVFAAMHDAVEVHNTDGVMVKANAEALALYDFDPIGMDRKTRNTKNSLRYLDGSRVPLDALPTCRAERGERFHDERFLIYHAGHGADRVVQMSAAPLYKEQQLIGTVVLWQDMTEHEKMLQQLRDHQRILEETVQARTAELAHTVKILTAEVSRRTLAEEGLRDRSEQLRLLASELTIAEQRERQRVATVLHDDLQQLLVGARLLISPLLQAADPGVQGVGQEAMDLLAQTLQCSRSLTEELSPPMLRRGGLRHALEWLVRWMAEKHHLTVHVHTDDAAAVEPPDMTVLLFQAIRELLFNVTKHAQTQSAWVTITHRDAQIQVQVADAGVGFEPTLLRVAGGTAGGFGLFSLRERLELLGGRLEIESAPGKGSRFTLLAPMEAAAAPETLAAPLLSQRRQPAGRVVSGRKRTRVLVVDDHVIVRQGLVRLLNAEPDLEVVGEASDGHEAVELTGQLRPDVVVMDVGLRKQNGVEATRAIHAGCPEVQVIGLSMYEEAEKGPAMREAGAANYLSKLGPSEALLAAIRACVRSDV
ncbi:MAG TPA: PAS domain S-box protein [Candidatus Methylomirabilis sp.]|nr:PAS domain S-box protein [Candidatus Methylomirabilis sp.]